METSRRIFMLQKTDVMRNFGCRQRDFLLIMDSGPHDLREISEIVDENEQLILEKWNEFFRP